MLFDANFDERYLLDAINNGFKIPEFVHLRKKFFPAEDLNETIPVELSAIDCTVLLSLLDHICKALLVTGGTELKSLLAEKIPALTSNWEISFLKSSTIFFDLFKNHYKENVEFQKILELIGKRKFE